MRLILPAYSLDPGLSGMVDISEGNLYPFSEKITVRPSEEVLYLYRLVSSLAGVWVVV